MPPSAARGQRCPPARGLRASRPSWRRGRRPSAAPSLIGRGSGAAMLAEAVLPVPWKLVVAAAAAAAASVGAVPCFFASLGSRR